MDRQIDADAYHIWTPRPLIRSVYWRPEVEPPREAVAGSYEVFIDQRAFVAMHEHVWTAAADDSPFGYLVGDLCEDPSAGRRFIIVNQVVPSRFPFRENDPEQIGEESSVALQLEVERKRGSLVGWYHAHETGEAGLSEYDVATHERLFPDAWQIAVLFVTDARHPTGATFRRTPDGMDGGLPLPFYEMVTNESLLAKGIRRSRMDWENVSTLDGIRSEPPPRPPAPPLPEVAEEIEPTAGQVEAEPEPEVETAEPEPEPAVETAEPEPEPAVEASEPVREPGAADAPGPDEVPAEPADHEDDAGAASIPAPPLKTGDDLDFDAIVAEVERAGLAPEPEEDVDLPPGREAELDREAEIDREAEADGAAEADGSFEEVFQALEEVEEELGAEVEKHQSRGTGQESGIAADELTEPTEADAPDPDLHDEPGTRETAEAGPATERAAAEPPETESVASVDSPDPIPAGPPEPDRAQPVEPALPEAGPDAAQPPASTGDASGARRRVLLGAGLVVALASIWGLYQLFGTDRDAVRAGPSEVREQPSETVPPTPAPGSPTSPAGQDETAIDEAAAADSTITGEAEPGGGDESPAQTDAVQPVDAQTLERLSDGVLESISSFYGRIGAFDSEQIGCAELQSSFVEVMDSWIEYNTRGKAGWQGRLPADLEQRDERLYRGVQDVERLFEGTSCPRP